MVENTGVSRMELAPEVQGAIVGGTIGIASALVTAVANHFNLRKRLTSKNQRRLAEFFLDKKVEALTDIHARLTSCYTVLGNALQDPSGYTWDDVRTEVHPPIDDFETAITVGDIYLDAGQEAELRRTVDEYRAVGDKIAILENSREDMIDDVFDATERAGGTLAEEISDPIRRIEGHDESPEEREEATAERRDVPSDHDSSNWASLATHRDRLREVFRVTEDGTVEFRVEVEPPGRALFFIIARRYAFERDLVTSPTVSETELLDFLDDSPEAVDTFVETADDHLLSDDGEYFVEVGAIEGAVDWATAYIVDEKTTDATGS